MLLSQKKRVKALLDIKLNFHEKKSNYQQVRGFSSHVLKMVKIKQIEQASKYLFRPCEKLLSRCSLRFTLIGSTACLDSQRVIISASY